MDKSKLARLKRPVKPRRPQKIIKKIELLWSSEEQDVSLADLLHLIPKGVSADDVLINVDKDIDSPHVFITYSFEMINFKYEEQMCDYEIKYREYEKKMIEYEKNNIEWRSIIDSINAQHDKLYSELEDAFKLLDALVIND